MINNAEYICALSFNGKISIYLLILIAQQGISNSECNLQFISRDIPILNNHLVDNLYDTTSLNNQVLCCRNKNNLQIECIIIEYEITQSLSLLYSEYTYTASLLYSNIILSLSIESSENDDCKMTQFSSEFLFCCAGKNLIKCSRLQNNFNLLGTFILDIEGDNSFLNIVFTGSIYTTLFFINNYSSQDKLYEYYIFIPECINLSYTIIVFHSLNQDKIENKETINDFFTRKTNTQYYINFENIPEEYGNLTLNNELINSNSEKILINESYSNILDFISTNHNTVSNFEILYTISIYETYSAQCKINLTILPCYESCDRCSKDDSSSNSEEHNCIENKCKDDYYKDPTKSTNCFKISEKKSNWYFDYSQMKFGICDNTCDSCNGPSNKECLTCYNPMDNPDHAFLYNNSCLNDCPDGTYKNLQSEGYYKCLPCYENCKTCSINGDSINMNCDSCEEKNIFYEKNCYKEYDSKTKTFYKPESNEITSCYEILY